ncbi:MULTISPECIES: hypothetical protein [unclassified Amycolatopsis]|uniref:hypothetical protein n=1 Tax=unclassified Amycolatopsis TaxID=2618356 RepID=UPI001C6A3B67|nr:hypothetical protein [Amycolatopsis sp. DSM 110486]QYN26665.1 hypothetical protein K1T34_11995 [Amycolatopsis sp. DSM 110486]
MRLWPRRRASRASRRARDDIAALMPYGPYSSVRVRDDALEPGAEGRNVAYCCFTDPDEATRCHAAWQQHAPALTSMLLHDRRSAFEPDVEGSYLHADGTRHVGLPPEITALMTELAPPSAKDLADRHALEAEQVLEAVRAEKAAWEARQPKEVVLAEAGDDSPIAHHDKFIKATRMTAGGQPVDRVKFHFAEFTGDEPEPAMPERGDTDDDRRRLVCDEFDVARALWAKAVYRREATPVLRAAASAWPEVAESFARIGQAWSDLDDPPHGWEVAVKRLLDAHDHARPIVENWEHLHARKLVTVGAELTYSCGELTELRKQLSVELGIDNIEEWHIGRVEDDTADPLNADIRDGASVQLENLIQPQRDRLALIADVAGRLTA